LRKEDGMKGKRIEKKEKKKRILGNKLGFFF